MPKIARPVDHKSIEYILKNPFFIGKMKVDDEWVKSKAHQALIDSALFNKVQEVLKRRNRSVRYIDKPFYAYRGLVYCSCKRSFSPYEQKGNRYYRSKCKTGCDNSDCNLTETDINKAIQSVLDQVYFTDEELADIESQARNELDRLSQNRDKKLIDLQTKQRNIMADLDYLTQSRITLMRSSGWTPQYIASEERRLGALLDGVHEEIRIYGESAGEMLKYVIKFSELVKNASLYFKLALDSERQEIATAIFTELIFKDRQLVSYKAKDGFASLLSLKQAVDSDDQTPNPEGGLQSGVTGSPNRS